MANIIVRIDTRNLFMKVPHACGRIQTRDHLKPFSHWQASKNPFFKSLGYVRMGNTHLHSSLKMHRFTVITILRPHLRKHAHIQVTNFYRNLLNYIFFDEHFVHSVLNLYHAMTTFNAPEEKAFWKHCGNFHPHKSPEGRMLKTRFLPYERHIYCIF